MEYEKKYFGNGSGNFDDADFILQPNQWVNMENCRVGSTDNGVIGTVESIGKVVFLSDPEPSVTNVVIGSAIDEENNRILYFLKDLYGPFDKIVCYDLSQDIFLTVLFNFQVTGGLNFDKNSLIHSTRVNDGMLYWVDGEQNQPRKVNINAGLNLNYPILFPDVEPYTFPVDWREITLIKPPPPLAPNIQKNEDATFANNFIANESFSFAYQYIYYDNETTVLGTYSPASRLNKVTDDFNRIIVSMDINERVPSTVRIVNLVVRISNKAFIIKTWDKDVSAEAGEIEDQNDGTQVLTFNFYNNITGQAISDDVVLKPFDSVPIYSETLEIAKNRIHLGNNVEGYDTPVTTSLSYILTEVEISGATGLTKNLIEVIAGQDNDRYSAYYVYITELSPVGYYAITATEQSCSPCSSPPPFPAPPTTVAISGLTFRGATQADAMASAAAAFGVGLGVYVFTTTGDIVTITGSSVSTYDIFKTQSQYKIGVVFYDFAMRKCGVVTKPFSSGVADPGLVSIPARNYAMTTGVNSIVWSLSNTDAVNEIPDWAYYYTVVRTLNLRTRYFLQAIQQTSNAKYVTKDADGNYEFTSSTFVSGAVGIGLDTTSLIQAGLGYVFTPGDVCYLIKADDTAYTLSVIDQSGKYIIVNVPEGGIGDLSTFRMVYEIYTPYQSSDQEPYYEMGNMYRVLNPGTVDRIYEVVSDVFSPDAYALTRNFDSVTYFAEAMSPNDRFFSRWDNDSGKVNFVVKQGQRRKAQNISFSNTFIPGTATNGLSTFEALNEASVPLENGPIRKLMLTSKTQDQGNVMLAICENETSSVYLGETQIVDSSGATQFFASATGVIGTINNLKGSFGTINPESVTEFRGNVYWVDIPNGKVVQYSLNGLFPISSYKMSRYWQLFSEQYLSMTQSQIEALGSRPFIFTTVDPKHWELLISVPKLLNTPPKGYLPDYPSRVYPFDIWDGQAKTLVYKLNMEPNFWQGSYTFGNVEGFVAIQNRTFKFRNGWLFELNSTGVSGTTFFPRIMFICNQVPSRPKVYNNISLEVNLVPTLTYFMSEEPYQQISNLQDFDWENKEGVLYSQIYRNVLTPSATGLVPNALVVGEKMRTFALRVMLEFNTTNEPLELRFVNLGYSISLGHKT